MSFTIASEYGYVLAVASVGTVVVNAYHTENTGKARKRAKVPYPIAYADKESAAKDFEVNKFNCAQKAHAQYTENLTPFLSALLVAGLGYPKSSAALGLLWQLSRLIYVAGYSSGNPKARMRGSGYIVAQVVLTILAGLSAYNVVVA